MMDEMRIFGGRFEAGIEINVLLNGEISCSLLRVPERFYECLCGAVLQQFASNGGSEFVDVHFVSYETLNPIATDWNTQGESHAG